MDRLDRAWLDAHPLPVHDPGSDKNERGRVLVIGGARFVPGALRLTGEAALRAGCGKLQLATIEDAAMALGVLLPEAAMIALPADEDGEIGRGAIERLERALDSCDCVILGPGMVDHAPATPLVEALLGAPREGLAIILDAAAIACAARHPKSDARRLILTPHHGEMAALTGESAAAILDDPARAAADAAARFGAVIVLKSSHTIVAGPSGAIVRYQGGGVGLATSGSGDVLTGVAGGLVARGAEPFAAAAWAVWLHGEAGRARAADTGPIGFLARELLDPIPRLMAGADQPQA